jgi:hypothetical protein
VHYEEPIGLPDFGQARMRIARFAGEAAMNGGVTRAMGVALAWGGRLRTTTGRELQKLWNAGPQSDQPGAVDASLWCDAVGGQRDMERPERAAAVEYLRRKGTDAPAARLLSGLRTIFLKLEQTLERVPEAVRTQRPTPRSWSVHEIVDHLIASHRPAAAELRDLCAGVSPLGGPIPARLTSPDPFERPWPVLIEELKHTHAEVLAVVANADDAVPLVARAPFVMVVKMQ